MYEIFADLHVHIGRSENGKPIKITAARSLNFANIAKECADWMRRKVCFKTNTTREGMNNFLLVDGDEDTYTYMPMNTFTTVDLGCERGNNLTNMITRMENPASKEFLHMFDSVWNDEENPQPVAASFPVHFEQHKGERQKCELAFSFYRP